MKFRDAKKLHSHDEVVIKATGEVTEVISTEVRGKDVLIATMTREDGYKTLHHTEIK